jgi:carboxymethylenebutenolidase
MPRDKLDWDLCGVGAGWSVAFAIANGPQEVAVRIRPADEKTSVRIHDREVPVEVFSPETGGPWPGLLVIHEILGLNDDIRRIARRFADSGYLAATPDLMAGGFRPLCVFRAFQALQVGSGAMVEELEAIIELLEAREDVTRVGAVGFCMGGGFALLLGTRESVSAAGVFYGGIRPREELERACPLVGGYGAKDRLFAPLGRKLIDTLNELGKEHDICMYDGAGHSYMNRAGLKVLAALSRPLLHVEYNEEAAEDSWKRMLAFFGEHLG